MKAARDVASCLRVVQSLQTAGLSWMSSVKTREAVSQSMMYFMTRLSLSADALPPVIHIAGTKGKGSTAAMCESILRQYGLRTGLFTSPHLVSICERYKIDGTPVDEARFLGHFWDVWDCLNEGPQPICPPALQQEFGISETSGGTRVGGSGEGDTKSIPRTLPPLPGFNMMTLVGLQLFMKEKVDVLVLEVGLGGRLDATNVISQPAVCGVTTLDFDHVELLGHTLTSIASEKAGIFKPGVPALTAPQRRDAACTLVECAREMGTPLFTVDPAALLRRLPSSHTDLPLNLQGDFQRTNAAVAVGLVDIFMHQLAAGRLRNMHMSEGQRAVVLARHDPSLVLSSHSSSSSSSNHDHGTGGSGAVPTVRRRVPSFDDSFGASSCPHLVEGTPAPLYDYSKPLTREVLRGLETTKWPGRNQRFSLDATTGRIVEDSATSHIHVFMDGAHTELSMIEACKWYWKASNTVSAALADTSHAKSTPSVGGSSDLVAAPVKTPHQAPLRRVLVFNCGMEKDALQLLLPLSTLPFDTIYFTTVPWLLTPRTIPPTSASALRTFVSKKLQMEDTDAVEAMQLGVAQAGMVWEDVLARDDSSEGLTGGESHSAPGPLVWQHALQHLHKAVLHRPEFSVLRSRLASLVGAQPASSRVTAAPTDMASGESLREPQYHILPTIAHVLEHLTGDAARQPQQTVEVLVTGSLYLVGATLTHLDFKV